MDIKPWFPRRIEEEEKNFGRSFETVMDEAKQKDDMINRIKDFKAEYCKREWSSMNKDEIKTNLIGEPTFPKNFARQEEHKTIEYRAYTQEFTTTDETTGEVSFGKFYVPLIEGKIIHKDNATVVILKDGSKGIAMCGKKDTYSRKEGLKWAYKRAMAQYFMKEIH